MISIDNILTVDSYCLGANVLLFVDRIHVTVVDAFVLRGNISDGHANCLGGQNVNGFGRNSLDVWKMAD